MILQDYDYETPSIAIVGLDGLEVEEERLGSGIGMEVYGSIAVSGDQLF